MCPPGTDQTTRMPQKWRIVIPGVNQAQPVKRMDYKADFFAPRLDPLAGCTEDLSFGVRLARYGVASLSQRESRADKYAFKSLLQSSQLLSLPVEIINNILDSLDCHGVINLGLTCSSLLHLALEHIDLDMRNHAAPWADQPLAILGNYLRDLPPPFFEDGLAFKSVNRTDLIQMDTDNGYSFIPRRFHYLPARQFYWATRTKYELMRNENQSGLALWLDTLDKPVPPGLYADYPQRVIIKNALLRTDVATCSFTNDLMFAESGYYLRDLTSKKLVRLCICDGLDKAHVRSSYDSRLTNKYRLDDIMLVQTRWSSFGPEHWGRMHYFAEDPKGPWAGHRFDVTTVRAHHEQTAASVTNAWQEVTQDVLIKVAWEQDYTKGLGMIGDEESSEDARKKWSIHMSHTRKRLRAGGQLDVSAKEIFGWTAVLEDIRQGVDRISTVEDPWQTQHSDLDE